MALSKTAAREGADIVQIANDEDVIERVEMSISPEAMALIIDRLTDIYKRPIDATVRETVSNAIDATRKMPSDLQRPVEITLPTSLRATFVVRDYGVGMSPDDVRKVFSQYGASTKRTDMTQTGAYGLGAKAPLSYCTEFMVVTTKDGVTTKFVVSREPSANFTKILSITQTDEPSGTVVTIPARLGDVSEFQNALESYRSYSFDVPIKIDGNEFNPEGFALLTDDFVLDHDEDVRGRVWVREASLPKLFSLKLSSSSFPPAGDMFRYLLSGWTYSAPSIQNYNYNYYRADAPSVIVELKPGVVSFSSSRDEITLDDTSRRLDKRVTELLTSISIGDMNDILRVVSEAPYAIYRNVITKIQNFAEVDNERGVVSFKENVRRCPISIEIDLDQLTHSSGANLLEVATAPAKPSLLTALHISPKSPFGVYESSENKSIYNIGYDLLRPREALEHWDELLDADEATLAFSHLVIRNRLTQIQDAPLTTLLVRDWTTKQAKAILRARATLAKMPYNGAILMLVKDNDAVDEQIALVEDALKEESPELSVTITNVSAAALLKEIRDFRNKNRVVHEKGQDVSVVAHRLTDGQYSIEKEVVDNLTLRAPQETSILKMIDEDALIIFQDRYSIYRVKPLVIGAANMGMGITDRPIYVLSNQNIQAAGFALLEGYKRINADPDFKIRSKAAQRVIGDNRYSASILRSVVKEASLEEIIASVMKRSVKTRGFYAAAYEVARDFYSTERALLKLLKTASEFDVSRGDFMLAHLSDEDVKYSLPGRLGDLTLKLWKDALQYGYSSSLNDTLLYTLQTYNGDIERNFATDELIKIYLDRLLSEGEDKGASS